MATYTKRVLSGSTNGKAILVVATATLGTTIHTAVSGTSSLDEVWIYAHNTSASSVQLTLEWGEATAPNGNMSVNIAAKGTGAILVVPGILLQNSLVITAFAGTASVINIFGYVNRIA